MHHVYQCIALAFFGSGVAALASTLYQKFMFVWIVGFNWLVMFAPLVMIFYLRPKLMYMNITSIKKYSIVFSILIGLALSSAFTLLLQQNVARIFFILAWTFGAMSLYGHYTNRDLTTTGSFMIMLLLGIVTTALMNLFIQGSTTDFIVSVISVTTCTLLAAYHSQKIKQIYYQANIHDEATQKLTMYAALSLYMDFFNPLSFKS